jgi:RNA polymerase sigma-70 factor, ECF subfamily
VLEEVFRAEWARVLASLVRFCGDIDVAEDAAQEAFTIAAGRWAHDGPPDNPRAWLVATGRNRAIDRLRRDRSLAEKTRLLDRPEPGEITMVETTIPDERLELVFLCCHPALAPEAQVALTLRSLGGLSTPEIARAFLVSEETMKRRLTRARTKIGVAAIPFAVPDEQALPPRLTTVLAVLYLIFNQGYGDGRIDLAAEAIRLARTLGELMPEQPQIAALLALMLLHDSRRDARSPDGELVPLADQDRTRWDTDQIVEGRALLDRALARGARGPYAVQAAIAALQTEDPIDWPSVVALYATLREQTGSAVVELNRAVAVAEIDGPGPALAIVDALDLDDYRYYHSTRAELLRRLGDTDGAGIAYGRALDLTTTDTERRFLERRRAELGSELGV